MTKLIGLIDGDQAKGTNLYGKPFFFPNLALMKISAYYKKKGYEVDWYKPIKKYYNNYHKVFVSKVFTKETSIMDYITKDMVIGGSGYDFNIKLPEKIEHIYPDYDLYGIDYALGFLTRGCIRNCEFCIVPKKEGYIRKNADLEEFWNDQENIRFLDNNFLAYKNHAEELKKLIETGKHFDFNQGLDIRLITNKNASLLNEMKLWTGKRYVFAFDDIKLKPIIGKKIKILNDNGIKNSELTFFVLVGFNSTMEEDLERIYFLRDKKIRVYVMPYNKKIKYQRDLVHWGNYKPFYFKMDFETFIKKNYVSKSKRTKENKPETMLSKYLK